MGLSQLANIGEMSHSSNSSDIHFIPPEATQDRIVINEPNIPCTRESGLCLVAATPAAPIARRSAASCPGRLCSWQIHYTCAAEKA